ncbi:hypothetical protein GMDG_06117 [Pseudogymnoascus destructans 20631-21]|uniref:Uncharacterized protein n=1 Tax=Pseudogymnoascus destructans (strain ATCC MYA-4855 / 20631-21) TaxID=658429 RepID=L8FUE8_PSED2|nr:hypothetical protein GMDG_06117 [Pseudogymnoascus destructans 20631-21]
MAISNFLNPVEESIVEDEGALNHDEILQEIISEHLEVPEEEEEEEEEVLQPLVPTIQAARNALNILIEFAESSGDIKTGHLRAIESLDQELEALDQNGRMQRTLDNWLT